MDLRLDIERRKKSFRRERDHNEEQGDAVVDYRESSGERSEEKHHRKSKKSKSKRSRSSSSSSSSSSQSQKDEDTQDRNLHREGDAVARSQFVHKKSPVEDEQDRIRDKVQIRLRGRSWNKGNREQHDSRDGGEDSNWTNNLQGEGKGMAQRGRARFIVRNAPTGPNIQRSKWTSEENMVNRKQENMRMENQQDEKGGYLNGGTS